LPDNCDDTTREFFDPRWEETNIVLVDAATLRKAEHQFLSCEACNPEDRAVSLGESVFSNRDGSETAVLPEGFWMDRRFFTLGVSS
jgi:hypothetical protein